MLVVTRFRVPEATSASFRDQLHDARAALAACDGWVDGHVARNVDDPELWVLSTRWRNVGAYRRALSTYDVKLRAVPVLGHALDEPSAYEIDEPGTDLNVARARSLG
ncbi:antibiotic biosynthesis monooxygenase family protein [Nocardioides sp. AE5]|uniref:antibiotic biosynthesis monooxygenase family protein n=1 Tax=Nocardioides sp. AE5 TaxID=2962573 RepID=UPI0028814710|nr:antibiotic biosynthesis monooxygenase family protein [Nocardioides sp. AE5]MDT0203295.1 antibiotic biosynthesis monooxygenase family protein [Nocardioides sp. AE5]